MTVPPPHRSPPVCSLCGDSAVFGSSLHEATALPICHGVDCRMVADRQNSMSPAHFQQYMSAQSALLRSRRADQRDRARRLREKYEAEAAEEAAWWSHLGTLEMVRPLTDALRVRIPTGPRHSVAQGEERRRAHGAHLRAIMAEARSAPASGAAPDIEQSPAAGPDPMAPILCSMCGGGCCTRGGDHAYLSAQTMRRVMLADLDVSSGALLDRYLGLLPDEVMADSCIYHTPGGCALPRELRSETCNNYQCQALTALVARPADAEGPSGAVLVLQRRQDRWRQEVTDLDNRITAAALITEAGVVPLRPRPEQEEAASREDHRQGTGGG